jgi:beta-galactosidase
VADDQGMRVPDATAAVLFAVTGPGAIAAVDNGDNLSHEPFQATRRQAYHGRAVAFVRAAAPSGSIVVTATAPGLADATLTLEIEPAAAQSRASTP